MGIKVIYEKCTLCGLCVNECPFGAIEIKEGKIEINEKCTLCGLCVKVCPSEALFKEEKGKEGISLEEYKGIWFFAEVKDDKIASVSYEMLNASKKLKKKLNQEICGVVFGKNIKDKVYSLIKKGADKVYLIEDEIFAILMKKFIQKHLHI